MDLKILMVTPYFPPNINGVSLHVYNLVKGLTSRGVSIRVHTIRNDPLENFSDSNLKIDDLDVLSFRCLFDLRGSSKEQPISPSYVTSTIRACSEFDAVHFHDFPKVCNDFLIVLMKKLRPNIPLIFTPHGAGAPSPAYKLFSRIYWSSGIPQKVLQSVDHVIVVSSLQARLFTEICGGHKVSMIQEAVPPYYFVDKPTFIDDEKLRILFIGRIIEEKGIRHLLYALHKLTQITDRSKIELACVGSDCGYIHEVLKIIDHLKLEDKVKILGALPEQEKIKRLIWCDVLVLPSYYEAFGLPILEAMAQGKPVIASETVGAKSLVEHGQTGFLVKIGDSESITDALMRFLHEPKLKYEMGQRSLKHASKYKMANTIEKHIGIYEKLCRN